MSWEPLLYNKASIDSDGVLISWVQKYLEIYFSSMPHPDWFAEVIEDLHHNFHVPLGKTLLFFEVIGDDKQHFDYYILMLDKAIGNLKSMKKRDFFEYIEEGIRETWVELNDAQRKPEWLDDDSDFDEDYIGLLRGQKRMMYEQHGYAPDGLSAE